MRWTSPTLDAFFYDLSRECGRSFWERFPGVLPHKRATEPFRRCVFQQHWDGISRSRLGQREGIGSATVERWFEDFLKLRAAERGGAACPQVLGIDEHFFTRRHGYTTTFCDLRGHKVFGQCLCALVRKHFRNARIVADRFHVIRLINHRFLACWREIDPAGAKHRGLLSLMRRHRHNLKPDQVRKLDLYFDQFPALRQIYGFKQRLCYLLLKKHRTQKQCRDLVPRFF